MYYTHRHFYVTENMIGVWLLIAGNTCIAKFKKRYWADKARKHLQGLLDCFDFKALAYEISFLQEQIFILDSWSPDYEN